MRNNQKPIIASFLAILGATACDSWLDRQPAEAIPAPLSSDRFPHPATTPEDQVLFFYDSQCPECALVKENFLDQLVARLGISVDEVLWKDVSSQEAILELLQLEKTLGFSTRTLAPVIIAKGKAFCGVEAIRKAAEEESL